MAIPSRVDIMFYLKRKPQRQRPINPRIRAYGKARLDIAGRAGSAAEWSRLWKRPAHPFPFEWGKLWKQCIEYKVDDFAAEVGFFTDILGLEVNALDPGYAMFTSPSGDFYLAIIPAPPGAHSTPSDALRIQFMVSDVLATARELEKRGIPFEQWPQPCSAGSALFVGYFRTPHGICVDIWGLVDAVHPAESLSGQSCSDLQTISPQNTLAEPEEDDIEASLPDEGQVDPYSQNIDMQEMPAYPQKEDIAVSEASGILEEDEQALQGGGFADNDAVNLLNESGVEERDTELIEIEYVDDDDL